MDILKRLDDALKNIITNKPAKEDKTAKKKEIDKTPFQSEVKDKILSLGWTIVDMKKYKNYSFMDAEEEYLCSYNGWSFTVSRIADLDIEQGVWSVSNLIKNGKKVEFSVDIGCRNTTEDRLKRFLRLLECDSAKEFYEKEYSKYLEIKGEYVPGFQFVLVEYKPEKPRIVISVRNNNNLEKDMYLIIYQGWMDDIKAVLTTDKYWDSNSYCSASDAYLSYYVDDISKLDIIVNAFYQHVMGEIGYKLDDGSCFNNKSIKNFVSFLSEETGKYTRNGDHVEYEIFNIWDYRGYTNAVKEKYPMPNKVDGIEVFSIIQVTFNSTDTWMLGKPYFCYTFIVSYDKNRDKDNMSVRFVVYNSELGQFEYKNDKSEQDMFNGNLLIWDAVKPIIDEEQFGSPYMIEEFIINTVKLAYNRLGIEFYPN